tara:strand:- start:1498 stop:2163 length:666 start_codon:yes stop_codon:yes gene_type:complete
MLKFLGVIVARKGSMRIKNKNLKNLGNKKLIEYTFLSAKKSKKLNQIILTTNDLKIINLAKKHKINTPFIRPNSLAKSNTRTEPVILHLLKFYKKKYNCLPKNFVILQPTSPFRTSMDIDNSIKKYERLKSTSLVSVSEPLNSLKSIFIVNKNKLSKSFKKYSLNSYLLNGSIFIRNTKEFLKSKKLIEKKTDTIVTAKINSIDINDKMDLNFAKSLINNR